MAGLAERLTAVSGGAVAEVLEVGWVIVDDGVEGCRRLAAPMTGSWVGVGGGMAAGVGTAALVGVGRKKDGRMLREVRRGTTDVGGGLSSAAAAPASLSPGGLHNGPQVCG